MQSLERSVDASTGVVLDDVIATDRNLAVKVKIEGVSKYRVQFIGRGGQILTEVSEPSATYSFRGDEGYVRVNVIEAGWLWCTGISAPAPNGANTISCLGERF